MLVQKQYGPWLCRGIPDLAYGTSAQIPNLAYGTSAEIHSPGWRIVGCSTASLEYKPPRGWGNGCRVVRCLASGSIVHQISNISLNQVGTEWRPRVRSHSIFFLRLPNGQYGPVSQLSWSEKSCTGPFNWGGAHCAGENVKRRTGPFLRKSLNNQTRTTTQQKGRSPPRQPGTPRPGYQVHGPRRKQPKEHKRPHRQIQVRLNVHRNVLGKALIR